MDEPTSQHLQDEARANTALRKAHDRPRIHTVRYDTGMRPIAERGGGGRVAAPTTKYLYRLVGPLTAKGLDGLLDSANGNTANDELLSASAKALTARRDDIKKRLSGAGGNARVLIAVNYGDNAYRDASDYRPVAGDAAGDGGLDIYYGEAVATKKTQGNARLLKAPLLKLSAYESYDAGTTKPWFTADLRAKTQVVLNRFKDRDDPCGLSAGGAPKLLQTVMDRRRDRVKEPWLHWGDALDGNNERSYVFAWDAMTAGQFRKRGMYATLPEEIRKQIDATFSQEGDDRQWRVIPILRLGTLRCVACGPVDEGKVNVRALINCVEKEPTISADLSAPLHFENGNVRGGVSPFVRALPRTAWTQRPETSHPDLAQASPPHDAARLAKATQCYRDPAYIPPTPDDYQPPLPGGKAPRKLGR